MVVVGLVAHLVANERPAAACSQPHIPSPGKVSEIRVAALSSPKNMGLVLVANAGADTGLEAVQAQTRIEVRDARDNVLEGSLRLLNSDLAGSRTLSLAWQPKNDTPLVPGSYKVVVTLRSREEATPESPTSPATFTIEDRDFVLPKSAPIVRVERDLSPDEGSPKITCAYDDNSTCSGGASDGSPMSIASRARVTAVVRWEEKGASLTDEPFVSLSTRVFARMTSGAVVEEHFTTGSIMATGAGGRSFAPADEYCVERTSSLIVDSSKRDVVVVCTPRSFSLSVSDDENDSYAKSAVSQCRSKPGDTVVYPDGHSAEDPAGVNSGCSMSPMSPVHRGSTGSAVLAVLAFVGLRLRRKQA
jgi:hypothetical protein